MNVSAITFRPGRVVGIPGGGGCPRQRVAAVYCRAHCCKMHPAGLVAGGAELRWALLGFSGHCWTRGSHPRAQKCRFCVKTTQNLGKIAHFDTKTSILCSKSPKTRVPKVKSAQKCRFCARKERQVASGSVKWPSCKSPRAFRKCKYLITR